MTVPPAGPPTARSTDDPTSPPTSPPTGPTPPDERSGFRDTLSRVDPRAGRINLIKAVPATILAFACFAVGTRVGDYTGTDRVGAWIFGWTVSMPAGWGLVLVIGLALGFVIAGIVAVRSIAKELARVSRNLGGVAAASAIRLVTLIVGYVIVLIGAMTVLQLNLGNLLVGGALTGVVLGIAAQQTLGNFFAGMVLFFARPYVPGQRVRVHTGALGGPFDGTIIEASVMYTSVQTDAGLMRLPNAGLLAAAVTVDPAPLADADADHDPGTEPAATSSPPRPVAADATTADPDALEPDHGLDDRAEDTTVRTGRGTS
ncbi:mechanosensitive ion channel domain-containing protein [Nakamurella leprariae]|uniref:Mechanosensitive ion channel family protein n=1 Tax=Nakamurella leprariae TaxID=2803911 RepID=A0A939BUS3_9ACTN|nr:mechanosensitive ion channel family protein [Nakamurella leprariae]MBM9465818.1 mechanosensitive ion channel family protein [Nakamurella leprariae]